MKIAQIAPLMECVPPTGYGGTELVVSLLTEELVKNGHEVTLFASGDSRTDARLVSVVPKALRKQNEIPQHRWPAYDLKSLIRFQEMQDEFDIVHNHMGYQALPLLKTIKRPSLSTNHNLISDYCTEIYMAYSDQPLVAISDAYRRLNYPDQLNYLGVVYNGIDVDIYKHDKDANRTYLLFIGRVSADKGTADAIDLAVKLGLPLKIAGKVDVVDQEYFNSQVKPRLNHPEIEFLGEVGLAEKIDLYRNAIAVLYPIAFDEPFGLVMAESLASGTPVLSLDRGSVREVISDGETGIVAKDLDTLLQRFNEVDNISNEACRQRACRLFSKEQMTKSYEHLYHRLIDNIQKPGELCEELN